MATAAIVAGGAVLGSVVQGNAAKSAAKTQANAIGNAARTTSAAAAEAKQEILGRMVPALANYGKAISGAQDTIRAGTADVMKILQESTGQASAFLNQAGANARQALLGSAATAAGMPRAQFNQQFSQIASLPPDQQDAAFNEFTSQMAPLISQSTGVPVETVSQELNATITRGLPPPSTPSPTGVVTPQGAAPTPQIGFGAADTRLQEGQNQGLAALIQGTQGARGDITAGRDASLATLATGRDESLANYTPYAEAGTAAINKEAALSGAMGPEAQQQAINEFIESPGQKYLREQQEQTLLRNSSAIGGLGGGRVRTALMEQAMGIASTQQQQHLENLRSLAGRGQDVAGAQANIIQGTAGAQSNVQMSAAQQLASLAQQLGVNASELMTMTAAQRSALAERTGINVAQLEQTIGTAQAALASQSGSNMASVKGGMTSDLANLATQGATTQLSGQQNISQILANLATQSGSQIANLQTQQGSALAAGTQLQGQAFAQGLQGVAAAGTYAVSPTDFSNIYGSTKK